MRILLKPLQAILMMTAICCSAQAQVVVDQLIAAVNGSPITESDVLWGLALDPSLPDLENDKDARTRIFERNIDLYLLLDEASRLPVLAPTQEEIDQALRRQIGRFPSEAAFRERIQRVGLTADMLQKLMERRVLVLKFVDFRFRSFAVITDAEILRYYKDVLSPKMVERGVTPAEQPSEQERTLIESILTQESVSREIDRFLENARRQADIVMLGKL